MGVTPRYPGSGSDAGDAAVVIVSPTRTSRTFLRLPATNPTSPGPKRGTSVRAGRKQPTSVTSKTFPVAIILRAIPFLISPSISRIWAMTPL